MMQKIVEQISEWTYLKELPPDLAGFRLTLELSETGTQYNLFSYEKPAASRRLSVVYDNTTKDFLARVKVGLNEYYDVAFISTELTGLEQILTCRLMKTLEELSGRTEYESILRAKKILEWGPTLDLPPELAGFSRFITPDGPVKSINGSYIILDYSDFAAVSNLIVYYNVYRDEFFGEIRLRQTPEMTNQFDARELDELAGKLADNLAPALAELRRRIDETSV